MVPVDLKAKLEASVEPGVRTFSDVVRENLRRGSGSAIKQPDDNISPARALGRLIELHADDVASYCPTPEEWHREMRASVPILLGTLFGGDDEHMKRDVSSLASIFAQSLAQRVRRAHLPSTPRDLWGEKAARAMESVQPSLRTLQDELVYIQRALHLVPTEAGEVAGTSPVRQTKGKR